jgi:hypothetical protein
MSFSQVLFTGYLVNEDNAKMKDVTVSLYSGNEKISSEKWSKKFDYNLELQKYYTLELQKEGYLAKRIAISTFEGDKGAEPFMFVMELVEAKEGREGDDFPSALIKYEKDEGSFNFDVKYSKSVKKEQKLATKGK